MVLTRRSSKGRRSTRIRTLVNKRLTRKPTIASTDLIRELLTDYLMNFMIINQNNQSNYYLNKANIKLICLFLLSAMELNDNEKKRIN